MNTHLSTPHTIASSAVCRGINHVLRGEIWASAELARHTGKTILLQLPLGGLAFEIMSDGLLAGSQEISEIVPPTLTLEVSSKALSDLMGSSGSLREQAFKAVKITGDADLAQLLGRLAGQLRWDYEEDLARLVGDAPANFAVRQGKKFVSVTRSAAGDLLDNIIEYVSEEKSALKSERFCSS